MDDAFTIQISSDLVKQLANDTDKAKKKTRKPKPKTPKPSQQNKIKPAIRSVLQDSEKVFEKLEKKEDEMVVEVTQKAKELHDKEFKLPQPKPMPCSTDLTACLECYKENTKDPLKCSTLVKNFADCARTIRQQVSSSSQ
ncbi:hypothetical protein HanHA300_Chr13g0473381 [Helianthus annuus]|nr:hypothetical protein HanHA300_Chr13g0473381 [Helianthus annuus]KAJ0496908.1 hypothetical protein HanHA89_Chr13g0505271 [Helianthus annuus]KAJ0662941.1 hypothetical protein HanLR1_Chr13g0475451 [Helianthus annuus]